MGTTARFDALAVHLLQHMQTEEQVLFPHIRELAGGTGVPPEAGTAFRTCFDEPADFERDPQRHAHRENDALFPGGVALEAAPI